MPGGLAALVDQDGRNLSAGERARLAVARVLVADRPVVLLDEPTAHLDEQTEGDLVETLTALAQRALVVAVTHRGALVKAADQVTTLTDPAPEPDDSTPVAEAGLVALERTSAVPTSDVAERDVDRDIDADDSRHPTGGHERSRMAVAILLGTLASLCGIALTATAAWLIVRAASHPPVLVLLVAIVAVRTFGLARPALRYAERLWSHDVALRSLADKRAEVFAALVPLTPGRLRRRGAVLGELVEDVEAFVDRRLRVVLPIWTIFVAGTVATVLAGFASRAAGAVDLALLTLAGFGVVAVQVLLLGKTTSAMLATRQALADQVTAVIETREEVRAWGAVRRTSDQVAVTSDDLERRARRISVLLASGRAAVVALTGLAVGTTLMVVAPRVDSGQLSAAMAGLLVLLPLALGELLQPGPDLAVAEVETRHALQRLRSVTGLSPLVQEAADAGPAEPGPAVVELDQVDATWDGVRVLSGIDARWRPGRRVGVVGASGTGKSTLAGLLVRFLDPSAGAVRYAGADLRTLHLADVRRQLCLLDDDPHVFATSVAANVRLAAPSAVDPQVRAALDAAGLGPWVDALPDGVDTLVGEGHRGVSGGERARLGLARLLLADPEVFVLDEPTAHLDASNARRVLRSVHAVAGSRTVVLISHRSADLAACDDVLDLDAASERVAQPGAAETAPSVTAAHADPAGRTPASST